MISDYAGPAVKNIMFKSLKQNLVLLNTLYMTDKLID